jgi:uncharacterized membrane protein
VETVAKTWVLKRNCAMTPGQLCTTFAVLGGVSLAVSLAWAFSGAWVVLPFVLLEWCVLALAFVVYARHAADHERITLNPETVSIEVCKGDRLDRHEIPRQWLRCRMDDGQRSLVRLASQKKEFSVGQFVSQAGRQQFYKEFRAALASERPEATSVFN